MNVTPQVTPTNMLGQLASATAPSGSVSFSYDGLGRVNARVFTEGHATYIEKHTIHADGTAQALDLPLPDTAFADEHVDYAYDSAGRGSGGVAIYLDLASRNLTSDRIERR